MFLSLTLWPGKVAETEGYSIGSQPGPRIWKFKQPRSNKDAQVITKEPLIYWDQRTTWLFHVLASSDMARC